MTKPVIVTRADKGSALTWTEGDTNLTNLRDATINVSADSGTTQSIDLNGTINVEGGLGLETSTSSGKVTVGITDSGLPTPFTGSVTAIDGSVDTITLSSTMGLTTSMQIQFTGANLSGSNIMSGSTYYITNIDSLNSKIQINSMMSGAMDLNTISNTTGITFSASGGAGGGSTYKLQYQSSTNSVSWAAESTTPTTVNLSSLGDVMLNMPVSDGDVLTYDTGTSKWKNEPATGGGASALDDLTDVTITSVASGDILQYDGSNWVDVAASSITVGTASVGSTVTLTSDDSTNATNYPLFANATTGNLSPRTDSGFTYNPSTGQLNATTFSGAGTFSTLSAASTVSGTGFVNRFASPGPIGSTTASTGKFTNLTVTGSVTANSSTGTSGQFLQTTGTGVQWATPTSSAAVSTLTDVTLTTLTAGQQLLYNGTGWVNSDQDSIKTTEYVGTGTLYPLMMTATGTLETPRTKSNAITFNASNGTLSATAFSGAGSFTTLSASSTVSGTGFSTYLASPPAIGGTSANTGKFTNLTVTGTVNAGGSNGTSGQVLQSTGTGVQWANASGGGTPVAVVGGTIAFQEFTSMSTAETTLPHTWTEKSDTSNLVTVSADTVTISSAGTYLIEYTNNYHIKFYAASNGAAMMTLPEMVIKLYNSSDATALSTTYVGGELQYYNTTGSFSVQRLYGPVNISAVVTIAASKSFTIRYGITAGSTFTSPKFVYTYSPLYPTMKITKLA